MCPEQNCLTEPGILRKVKALITNHDIPRATAEAQEHIAADRRDPYGYIALAIVCKKMRRFKDALIILDKAIEVGPDTVTAFSYRGFCRALIGDLEGALSDSKKALLINPRDRMALELKDHMERRINMGMIQTSVHGVPPPASKDLAPPQPSRPAGHVEPSARPIPDIAAPVKEPERPRGAAETKFVSAQLSQAIVDELENEKDSILVLAPKVQAMRVALATMQALTELYDMDGVVVCADRPARFLRNAFAKCSKKVDLIHYLEIQVGTEPTGAPPDSDSCCQAFDLENLIKVIEEDLQRKAEGHGGEDHFVMWDDVSALKFYHEPKALQRFFEALTDHLSGMGVVHVVVLPSEAASLLQRWPVSSFKATVNVKASWMSGYR